MSYLFSLSQSENRESLAGAVNGEINPEDFQVGFATGLGDVEQMLNTPTRALVAEPAVVGGLAVSTLLGGMAEFGKMADPMGAFHDPAKLKANQDFVLGQVDNAVKWRNELKIDPQSHGMAAQLLDSFASLIPQAVATGFVGTGVLSGIGETAGQIEAGKPLDTAAELGAITGVANAAGVAMPAAFGNTLAQRLATGAAANVAIGAGADIAKNQALENFPEEAKQYAWDNPQARAIDAVLGAAFGGLAHLQAHVKPSDVDAALVANEANALQTPDGIRATTPEANNALVDGMYQAMDDLQNDRAVSAVVDSVDFERSQPDLPLVEPAAVEYHPAITSLANDLTEGGGVAYTFDEYGKINGRTPSLNPDWYKDGAFKILGKNGEQLETTPTVAEIKKAVHNHDNGLPVSDRQRRILEALSDVAKAEEEYANQHYSDEDLGYLRDINAEIINGRISIDELYADDSPEHFDALLAKMRTYTGEDAHKVLNDYFGEDYGNQQTAQTADAGNIEKTASEAGTIAEQGQSFDTPATLAAKDIIGRNGDFELPWAEADDGDAAHISANELLKSIDDEMAFAENAETAVQSAISCFLRFGE